MRTIFTLWAAPMLLFWGWFGLSYYDLVFSRQFHDMYFGLMGQMLGLNPADIPFMAFKACVVDTLVLLAIWAFRGRREIKGWFEQRGDRVAASTTSAHKSLPSV